MPQCSIGRIHKNEQLLDWPFTRLLLESLYIKTSNYLQVKDHGLCTEQLIANPFLVNARYGLAITLKVIHKTAWLYIVLTWELASHGKQQVLVKAKVMYTFWAITRAMTRPFICRAIARPFTRLAIARFYVYGLIFMQPSMGTLNSPSSRVIKDSTPSRRRILRCIDFGIGESSPNLFLNMVNLYQ